MGIPNKQIGWSQESILLWGVSKELERLQGILGSGALGAVTSLTTLGSSGPATLVDGVLNIPIYTGSGGGGTLVSASNGLTATAGNVILGGTLSQNTNIDVNTRIITLVGNSPTSILRVTNSNNTTGSHGIQGVSGGANSYGISGVNTGTGIGVYAESLTGAAIRAVSQQGNIILEGTITPPNSTSVLPMIRLFRDSSNSGAVNGMGLSVDFYIKTDDGNVPIANRVVSRWTNTIFPSRTSEIILTGISLGVVKDLVSLAGNGLVKLNQYGNLQPGGAGPAVFSLNIDSSGNIIQAPLPVTNLSYIATPTNGTVVSDTGTDAVIPLVDNTNAGLMSPALFIKLNTNVEVLSNKQNSMALDGTGVKYPTVDATNLMGDNILKVTGSTGFFDRLDTFRLSITNSTTIHITASNPGSLVRTKLFSAPLAPLDAIVNIPAGDVLASSIALPSNGRHFRFLGWDYAANAGAGGIVASTTSFLTVDNIIHLAYVEMSRSGGTDAANTFNVLVTAPDLSTTDLFESFMIPNQTTVKIIPNANLTVNNTAGEIRAHNISWGVSSNPHTAPRAAENPSQHINLDPTYLTTTTGFPLTTDVNVTNYWNGTAVVPVPSPNNATIQRWLITLAGRLFLQIGDTVYATKSAADAALSSVVFQDIIPAEIAIEICKMVATKSATDLSDTTKVSFSYSSGGAGGSATPTPIFTTDNPGLVPAPLTVSGRFLTDNGTWSAPVGFALDTAVVHKTGNLSETITGTKTFSNVPVAPGYAIPSAPVDTVLLANGGIAPFSDIISGGQTELLTWKFLTAVNATDPGNNQFKMNNVTASLVTQLYVSDITNVLGADISALFAKIKGDWFIHIQATGDATKYMQFTTATAFTDNGVWWTIPVTWVQGVGFPINNGGATTWVMINQNSGGAPNTLLAFTDYNLPASSALQKAFNAPDDSMTLAPGVYKISWLFGARNLSNANTNISLGFLGTAAVATNSIKFSCNSRKSNNPDIPALDSGQSFQQGTLNTVFSITEFNNRSKAAFAVEGIIRIVTPGTIIPAVSSNAFNTGTAIVEDRQIFQITRINF